MVFLWFSRGYLDFLQKTTGKNNHAAVPPSSSSLLGSPVGGKTLVDATISCEQKEHNRRRQVCDSACNHARMSLFILYIYIYIYIYIHVYIYIYIYIFIVCSWKITISSSKWLPPFVFLRPAGLGPFRHSFQFHRLSDNIGNIAFRFPVVWDIPPLIQT